MSSPDKEDKLYAEDADDSNGGSNGGDDSGDDKPPRGGNDDGTGTEPEPGGLGGGPGGGGSGGGVGADAKSIHAPLIHNAGWMFACGGVVLLFAILSICVMASPLRIAILVVAFAAFCAAVRAGLCFQRSGRENDLHAAIDGQQSLVWLLRLLTVVATLFAIEAILALI